MDLYFSAFKPKCRIGFSDASSSSTLSESEESPSPDSDASTEEYDALSGLNYWCEAPAQDSWLESEFHDILHISPPKSCLPEIAEATEEYVAVKDFQSPNFSFSSGEILYVTCVDPFYGYNFRGEAGHFPENVAVPYEAYLIKREKITYTSEFMKSLQAKVHEKPQFLCYNLPHFLRPGNQPETWR